jgi:SAM-dependent methyltransferase
MGPGGSDFHRGFFSFRSVSSFRVSVPSEGSWRCEIISCQKCAQLYSSASDSCPACGFAALEIEGRWAWAPELAFGGGGFKAEYFNDLCALEAGNFWFRARNSLILWALQKYFPGFASFLEIGCGTGFVLSGVASEFPSATLYGSEIFNEGLGFAARRVKRATFMQMDARRIPYADEFDVIGAFDVLEHIAEDETVLAQLHRALKPGGGLLITVPQHPRLWSSADQFACHVRRYTASEIHSKVEQAGFEIVRSTSFVSLLLPAMLASRRRGRDSGGFDPRDEFRIGRAANRALEEIMRIERLLIRMGVSFPVGGSRLIVTRR